VQPDSPPADPQTPPDPPPAAGPFEGLTDTQIAWAVAAALVVGTFLLYARTLAYPFVNVDDGSYVTENQEVLGGLTAANVKWAFTTGWQGNWHPLTWLSLQLDATLWGAASAGPFRAVNVLIHGVNAALVFAVLRAMTGAVGRSAVVAALWAAHPLHVESVVWVSERKDVLSALFWLLATLAYAEYVRRPNLGRYALVAGAMALGLTAKAMPVTLPFALLLLDVWPLGRTRWAAPADGRAWEPASAGRLVAEKLPLMVLSAVASGVAVYTQSTGGAVLVDNFPSRASNALVSYVDYLRQTIAPVDLAGYYPYATFAPTDPPVLLAAAVLLAVTGLVVGVGRRLPYLPVGWLWFLGTLVPVIGIVQVGSQARADRYTYIPHVGLLTAAVWGAADLLAGASANARTAVAGVVVAAAALGTTWQTRFWESSVALWSRSLDVTPNGNVVGDLTLGGTLASRSRPDGAPPVFGIDPADARLALPYLQRAVAADPNQVKGQRWLGICLAAVGEREKALAPLLAAVKLDPDHADTRRWVASLLFERGRVEDAVAQLSKAGEGAKARVRVGQQMLRAWQVPQARDQFDRAAAEDPASAEARLGLGLCALYAGKVADAEAALQEAARLDPKLAAAHAYVGAIHAHAGRWADAVAAYEKAVEAEPELPAAQSGLGMALLGAGKTADGRKRYAEAVRLDPTWPSGIAEGVWPQVAGPTAVAGTVDAWARARQACEMTDYLDARAVAALAAVMAAEGKFKEAEDLGRKAAVRIEELIPRAPSDEGRKGLEEYARHIRAQLDRYKAGKSLKD
jgi:tetratricopeptide (TPR) repeat protein